MSLLEKIWIQYFFTYSLHNLAFLLIPVQPSRPSQPCSFSVNPGHLRELLRGLSLIGLLQLSQEGERATVIMAKHHGHTVMTLQCAQQGLQHSVINGLFLCQLSRFFTLPMNNNLLRCYVLTATTMLFSVTQVQVTNGRNSVFTVAMRWFLPCVHVSDNYVHVLSTYVCV